jgi:hypothetical protein
VAADWPLPCSLACATTHGGAAGAVPDFEAAPVAPARAVLVAWLVARTSWPGRLPAPGEAAAGPVAKVLIMGVSGWLPSCDGATHPLASGVVACPGEERSAAGCAVAAPHP